MGGGIYDTSASFGKFLGKIRTVILLILGLASLGYGLYNFTLHDKKMIVTQGTIKEAKCDLVNSADNRNNVTSHYSCALTVEYMFGEMLHRKHQILSSNTTYEVGNTIDVYINSENNDDVSLQSNMSKKRLGIIFTCIGAVLLFLAFLSWWILRYKFANAATAWTTVFRGVFGR